MITLVDGKGKQVNGLQFPDWDEAEHYLWEQRESGASGLYLYGEFGAPVYEGVYYIAVEFGDQYGLAIKAKHIPSPEELMAWIKPDMVHFGYTDIFEF